jgi:4-amino-4-deoxy-L-arabinose transferase-like glycosyltransferase
VLIGGPLLSLAFLDRRIVSWSWRRWACYLTCAAGLALPWYVGVALTAPSAAGEFLWWHNIVRYVAPFDHEEPFWFYGPSLLLGALPWTLLLVPLIPYLFRRTVRASQRRPAALGLFVLALAEIVGFFSLAGCKRPGYILPAFPLMALVLGTYLTHGLPWQTWLDAARVSGRVQRLGHDLAFRLLLATCGLGAVAAFGVAGLGVWSLSQAAALFSGLVAFVLIVRQLQPASPAAITWASTAAALALLLLVGVTEGLPHYHRRFTLREQVHGQLDVAQDGQMPIICYPKRWDSISFYLGRDIALYTPAQKNELIEDLQRQGESLLFVRRHGALQDLLQALPEGWEFSPRGTQGPNVATGVVRARQ